MTASSARAAAAAPRFAALRVPDYRRYFAWSLIAMTADNIEQVISYWVIFQVFHSPALAGFAVISQWLPLLLFSVYGDPLADRHAWRNVIQAGHTPITLGSPPWRRGVCH